MWITRGGLGDRTCRCWVVGFGVFLPVLLDIVFLSGHLVVFEVGMSGVKDT